VIGPLLWGLTTWALEGPIGTSMAYRAAVGVVALMFVISIWVLQKVPDRHARRLRAA